MVWHILYEHPAQAVISFFVLILLYFVIKFFNQSGSSFPRGPRGLPVVGYLPFLTKNVHFDFTELGKKYGPIYSMKLGSRSAVILCKSSDIREAMGRKEFMGRQTNNIFSLHGFKSIFFSNEVDAWKDHKKLVVRVLNDVKANSSKLETSLRDKIGCFLKVIESSKGSPLYLSTYLRRSVINNICAVTLGQRYEDDDPELLRVCSLQETSEKASLQTSLIIFFPWLFHIPYVARLLGSNVLFQALTDLKLFITEKIDNHKETLQEDFSRDFIDEYLKQMKTKKEENQPSKFTETMLMNCTLDLFGAGTVTVISTIRWCIYIIAAYPKVQKRIQKEIDEVIGSGRRPEFSDRKNMPYTHSFILETMRWKPVIPLGIIKCTISDVMLSGYKIPKGTDIFTNIWAVHHDPEYWDDPEEFRPERFLGPDGTVGAISDHFMSFMVGRRLCAGEKLANMELFLYVTSLLQNFDISFPSGFEPTFEAELNLEYGLKPFEVRFISRKPEINI